MPPAPSSPDRASAESSLLAGGPRAESLVLIGGGGHALVVAEAARLLGFHLPGYLDDHPLPALARDPDPLTSLGTFADLARIAGRRWILAVGNLELRRRLLESMLSLGEQRNAAAVVHPSAHVSPSARLGAGVYVGPNAVVHSRALVGEHAIINSGAIVEHEVIIGPNSHIAPGSVLGGAVRIGADTLVGLGARILPTLSVGNQSVIGAGSVVLRSVPDRCTAIGSPAKIARCVEEPAALQSLVRSS